MVGTTLVHAPHGNERGHGSGKHVELVIQRPRDAPGGNDAVHLLTHALARNSVKLWGTRHKRCLRAWLDLKPQTTGKAHSTKNAQRVLLKTPVRIPHRAHHPARKVFSPAKEVEKPAIRVVGHGIHRKVATGKVFPYVANKAHLVGVAAV